MLQLVKSWEISVFSPCMNTVGLGFYYNFSTRMLLLVKCWEISVFSPCMNTVDLGFNIISVQECYSLSSVGKYLCSHHV